MTGQHEEIRVGVIGAGRWAVQHHIPGVVAHPRARLAAIAEPDAERRAIVAAQHGVPGFATGEELIAAQLADAVIISSPAAAHHAAALAAFEHGLHALVEKPMAIRPEDAWDMVEAAHRHGCHLVVGYTFQFTHNAARARQLVAAGRIGEIQLLEASYASGMRHLYERPAQSETADPLDHPAPGTFDAAERAGGGQAASQASHVVASMLATSGLTVASVCAHTRHDGLALDLIDAALLELSNDAVGTLTSTGNLGPAQELHWLLRYYGTEGVLVHDLRESTLVLHGRQGDVERVAHTTPEPLYPTRGPVTCLIDLALGGEDNPAPGALGAQTVDLVDALYRSAAQRGAPAAISPRGT